MMRSRRYLWHSATKALESTNLSFGYELLSDLDRELRISIGDFELHLP